ncbi:MAG: 1,4-dihydroxy-2-naphthoate octaprenyltransferase [Cytophagales bacterium]
MPFKIKLKALIGAMRLRTLPLSLATIITGTALAILNYKADLTIFIFSVLTTVFLQVLSNFANDYGDGMKGTDNEKRLGPHRAVQSGIISLKEMKTAIIVTVFLSLVSGISLLAITFKEQLLGFLFFLSLGILSIWAAIRYTAGKNPYGYKAWGDFFVWLFFGIVGVLGVYFLHTKSVSAYALLMANALGFLAVSVLNMNNIRDIENDEACGKITLAVKLKFEGARIYQIILTFSAFILITITGIQTKGLIESLPLIVVSALPMLISFRVLWKQKTSKAYNNALKQISLSTFAVSILFLATVSWL